MKTVTLDITYVLPKQFTAFEKFVWENSSRGTAFLASETNRSERDVAAAYNRAHKKISSMIALIERAETFNPGEVQNLRNYAHRNGF